MKIWVDADACPIPIKEILFRAAERTGIAFVLFQGDIDGFLIRANRTDG
jgi:uncharacterized protein YaiI (UPF0178 family)